MKLSLGIYVCGVCVSVSDQVIYIYIYIYIYMKLSGDEMLLLAARRKCEIDSRCVCVCLSISDQVIYIICINTYIHTYIHTGCLLTAKNHGSQKQYTYTYIHTYIHTGCLLTAKKKFLKQKAVPKQTMS